MLIRDFNFDSAVLRPGIYNDHVGQQASLDRVQIPIISGEFFAFLMYVHVLVTNFKVL